MFMDLEQTGAAGRVPGALYPRGGSRLHRRDETRLLRPDSRKTSPCISLETSSERPPAKIGDGPILRVGDKSSIFDSAATATLAQIAADSHIPVQRCLMPGGTCEATAYQLYGFRSAALCVALGNYHNCGPGQPNRARVRLLLRRARA
jgi:hypothetical protein